MKLVTIIFLVTPTKVWLAKKKEKIGAGLYFGYGGKVEDNETIIQSAIRETKEESSVIVYPRDLRHMTVIDFYTENTHLFRGHIFLATRWVGEPTETEEMGSPVEFARAEEKLPLNEMLPGDKLWVPTVIAGFLIPPGGFVRHNESMSYVMESNIPDHHCVM